MKTKLKKILTPIICTIVLALAFGAGFLTSRLTLQKELNDIEYILAMYRAYYYEEADDVVGVFADSLLDAYSRYYTKEEYELIKKADAGNREGIGIVYSGLKLISVIGNSPAEKAGVIEGGTLKGLKTGDETVYFASQSEFLAKFSEIPAYTDMVLIVDYDGVEKEFTLQKQEYVSTFVHYEDSSGRYGFLSDDGGTIGFIRLGDGTLPEGTSLITFDSFSGTGSGLNGGAGQFARAMEAYKSSGSTDLILDLTDNGGGLMDILKSVAAHLIDEPNGSRPNICTIRDKHGNESATKSESVRYHDYTFDNIVVLADVNTASASEALIGAMLSYDKSDKVKVIVKGYTYGGKTYYRTYGKGIMQTTYIRPEGGAIKLTTAKLFWPSGDVCIHDVGITTDLNEVFGEKIINESEAGAYNDALSLCR